MQYLNTFSISDKRELDIIITYKILIDLSLKFKLTTASDQD